MEVKHVLGPWSNDYGIKKTGFGCGYGKSQIYDGKGRPIAAVAMVEPNTGELYDRGEYSKEAFECLEATSALIAAAPDLLAALHAAAGYLINAKINLETGAPKRIALATIEGGLKVVREALTKAYSEKAGA